MPIQKTQILKRIGYLILGGFFLLGIYKFYIKFEIIAFKEKQKEKDLIKNYQIYQKEFQDFITYSTSITRIENVVFGKGNSISFQIYDTMIDRNKEFESHFLAIGKNSMTGIQTIVFLNGDSILISSDSNNQIIKNWIIDYEGNMDDEMVATLLEYNRISKEQLKILKNKIEKLNCIGFDKNDKLLSIMKTGSLIDCFKYVYPLDSTVNKENLNVLSDNFYWEHYQFPTVCK